MQEGPPVNYINCWWYMPVSGTHLPVILRAGHQYHQWKRNCQADKNKCHFPLISKLTLLLGHVSLALQTMPNDVSVLNHDNIQHTIETESKSYFPSLEVGGDLLYNSPMLSEWLTSINKYQAVPFIILQQSHQFHAFKCLFLQSFLLKI